MKRAIWGMAALFTMAAYGICGLASASAEYSSLKITTVSKPISFEMSFQAGRIYTVNVSGRNNRGAFPLEIYEGPTLVYGTELMGDGGYIATARVREGKTDLVVVMSGGNVGTLNDFRIIGAKDGGGVGVLADWRLLKMWYTWTNFSDLEGLIGISFTPEGLWTRYRVDVVWDKDGGQFVATKPMRITVTPELPAADRTVVFSFKAPWDKIRYSDGEKEITEVRLCVGERLLLRRDPTMSQELALSYWLNYIDEKVMAAEVVGGSYLITAKGPGESKMVLFQPHNAPTSSELRVIVSE